MEAIWVIIFLFGKVLSNPIEYDTEKLLNMTVYSDTSTWVYGPQMPNGGNAVAIYAPPCWTAIIPGATWIWSSNNSFDTKRAEVNIFSISFVVVGFPSIATLMIAADDFFVVFVNSIEDDECLLRNQISFTTETQRECNLIRHIVPGFNILRIDVINDILEYPNPNYGGLLFSLSITSIII